MFKAKVLLFLFVFKSFCIKNNFQYEQVSSTDTNNQTIPENDKFKEIMNECIKLAEEDDYSTLQYGQSGYFHINTSKSDSKTTYRISAYAELIVISIPNQYEKNYKEWSLKVYSDIIKKLLQVWQLMIEQNLQTFEYKDYRLTVLRNREEDKEKKLISLKFEKKGIIERAVEKSGAFFSWILSSSRSNSPNSTAGLSSSKDSTSSEYKKKNE